MFQTSEISPKPYTAPARLPTLSSQEPGVIDPVEAKPQLGACRLPDGRASFVVWAPERKRVELDVIEPESRRIEMRKLDRGYFAAVLEGVPPASVYRYVLDGEKQRADPASRFQPRGVHGPSQVVEPADLPSSDGRWKGFPLEQYIIYELHVGTFTAEGTFDAAIPHLDRLKALGITAVELMPVAQFPGNRNWGYDGVFPFAAQNSYGGPAGLARLVNACHERELCVVLDVVYNHLGPEGNYLADFGPYFTDRYHTPWGQAINFDGRQSDEVAHFFTENALYWLRDFRIDALRLDAIHGIADRNARPFLEILADSVRAMAEQENRHVWLIAENDLNDARFIRPGESGGYGLDAQWNDDFHHAVHAALTGERSGYYQDFGDADQLAKALREGYVYSGQYSPYRQRRHGNSSSDVPARRFVVFAQNHDQVGNRALSERLSRLTSFEALKVAAGLVILSPFLPLLFMGEEYGEEAPFNFFSSYEDPALIEAVRKGRKSEFAHFGWKNEPPDPQAEATFLDSRLRHELAAEGKHRVLADFYRELISLRKRQSALACLSKDHMEVTLTGTVIAVRRWQDNDEVAMAFNLGSSSAQVFFPLPSGRWRKLLDSSDSRWLGEGARAPDTLRAGGRDPIEIPARSLCVFSREAPE